MKPRPYISFKAFFLIWARMQGWTVPAFHLRVCDWMERRGRRAVMKIFRGAGKSTILAIYQAWKLREMFRQGRYWRLIDRGADDNLATKLTRDTLNVLRKHPLCRGMVIGKKGVEQFSIEGHNDERNPSVTAYGIMSNATGSHGDEVINDDPEVPKNIKTPDSRRTLRERLEEEIHILLTHKENQILYVGTDHTTESIYKEKIEAGYDNLVIPLFAHSKRYEADGGNNVYSFGFPVKDAADFYVCIGIGTYARVLETWEYSLTLHEKGGAVKLHEMPTEGVVIDLYSGNTWPDKFDRAEIQLKRKECRTLNAWDSQYMLHARPVHEIRLNPDKCLVYESEADIRIANGAVAISIDTMPMTGVKACWDCSLGKKDSDDSAFSVMFQNEFGHYYWHRLSVLEGEVFDQCRQLAKLVIEFQVPSVLVKTTGIGGFLPSILRRVFKEQGVQCGVIEKVERENKVNRILNAYEAPLSGGFLHVHSSVVDAGLFEQMRDWIPTRQDQPDDLLDVGEECISSSPVKIGKVVKESAPVAGYQGFRPKGEVFEVQTTF